jgi:arylsulfatase A-like enzyme
MDGKKIAIGAIVALCAIGGIAAVLLKVQPEERPPPNVLIVLWDTTRADHLNVYGYDKSTTPFMAEWAKGGMVFEKAISPGMWTVPSHASMFTGLPETTHGAGTEWRWLDDHNVTLAEWFGQHGYETYAFSSNPNLGPKRVNLVQGFEKIDTSWSPPWVKLVRNNTKRKLLKRDQSTEISPSYQGPKGGTMDYNGGPVTAQAMVRWLDKREDKEKPWFAYLNYMEAHKPRVPKLESRKAVADKPTIRKGLETDLTFKSQLLYSYKQKTYTNDELEAISAVYDATLLDLDETTRVLMEQLGSRGYLDNTIVVFTSDHGEQLGEHHLFGHRNKVYQQLLHVPLVISWPGVLEPGRVEQPVSNLYLFDTLRSLAGLPSPETGIMRGNLTQWADLLPEVFSETQSLDHMAFSKVVKWTGENLDIEPWSRTYRTVILDDWKLIRDSANHHELFHLAEDPWEEHELAAQHPDKVKTLAAKLDARVQEMRPYDESKRTEADQPTEDDEDTKEQLRLLGYLDDEE